MGLFSFGKNKIEKKGNGRVSADGICPVLFLPMDTALLKAVTKTGLS